MFPVSIILGNLKPFKAIVGQFRQFKSILGLTPWGSKVILKHFRHFKPFWAIFGRFRPLQAISGVGACIARPGRACRSCWASRPAPPPPVCPRRGTRRAAGPWRAGGGRPGQSCWRGGRGRSPPPPPPPRWSGWRAAPAPASPSACRWAGPTAAPRGSSALPTSCWNSAPWTGWPQSGGGGESFGVLAAGRKKIQLCAVYGTIATGWSLMKKILTMMTHPKMHQKKLSENLKIPGEKKVDTFPKI